MNEINVYIGGQIRKYRKANGMTLQQLADVIHKSRATVCKYENGEISIDIATLYEISQALQVSFGQLTSYQPTLPPSPPPTVGTLQRSPFFQAKRLYFYFYDGRYHRLKRRCDRHSRARGAARHLCGELYALLCFRQRMQQ
ncbi:MAG: helix-turn-helix domain-containing protein [Dysosmobacter sp.]